MCDLKLSYQSALHVICLILYFCKLLYIGDMLLYGALTYIHVYLYCIYTCDCVN